MSKNIALIGLDIAKLVFQVHGADREGHPLLRRRLRRDEVEAFFQKLAPCIVALEACPSSHYWARQIRSYGHEVRLVPAQFVRPFVKSNKHDAADAEAICEAMVRPTMRFVPIKEREQQEILVIHRVRETLMRQRTQLINAIRGHLAEFGVIGEKRAHNIGVLTARIEDPDDPEIPDLVKSALGHLVVQLRRIEASLAEIEIKLGAIARQVEACRRIMTIPGVGVITATALVSSIRDPADFKSGRHFAAWLGLVPRQHSTGGVDKLGGISKRGDSYLRRLLIHGARSVMRWRRKSWAWLARIRDRRPANVVAVAMANKTARVVWALLRHGGAYSQPQPHAA